MKILAFMMSILSFSCNSIEKIYVGTKSIDGIFAINLDAKTGALTKVYQKGDVQNPGYLTFSPDKQFLYTVAGDDKIRAYKIAVNGELIFLNEKSSTGKNPCHIETSKTGKAVVVANYGSGDTTVISVGTDGAFSGTPRNHSHKKYSIPGKHRSQSRPRAHNVQMSPNGHYVFISDLGTDKIVIYKFDDNFEKLTRSKPEYTDVPASSGPRHFTFHPNGRFAYGINELNSTVSAYHYSGEGKLTLKASVSTKPKSWSGYNNCADIHVHPNGKFLYGSNRGNNSIVIYSINQKDGSLSLVGHESSRGNWPRNFAISPSGEYLLVANQKSNDIFSFRINPQTGKLSYTGKKLELPAPICLKFYK